MPQLDSPSLHFADGLSPPFRLLEPCHLISTLSRLDVGLSPYKNKKNCIDMRATLFSVDAVLSIFAWLYSFMYP